MRARFLTGCIAAVGFLGLLPITASADSGPSGFIDQHDNPVAYAREVAETEPSGSGGNDDCVVRVVLDDDSEWGMYNENVVRQFSATGRWLQRICNGLPEEPFPEGGVVDPAALAREAVSSVKIFAPAIATSPSADDRLYVQVATWLWLEGEWWREYSATANAGRVSATVRAMPTVAEWSMGDGGVVVCRGPGVPWRRGLSDSATYCKYTYAHSSAGEPDDSYTLSVTVTFDVEWSSNIGQGGSLGSIERTSSRQVQVGEIQGLETE